MADQYSLQDELGHCLHKESYRINGSERRYIEAGDGKRACGFRFVPTAQWRAEQRKAERAKIGK
jgi:hypothetical protein